MATRADLMAELLKLPTEERAEAAHELLVSPDGEDSAAEVEQAWRGELEDRVQRLVGGETETIDGDQVHTELRAELRTLRE